MSTSYHEVTCLNPLHGVSTYIHDYQHGTLSHSAIWLTVCRLAVIGDIFYKKSMILTTTSFRFWSKVLRIIGRNNDVMVILDPLTHTLIFRNCENVCRSIDLLQLNMERKCRLNQNYTVNFYNPRCKMVEETKVKFSENSFHKSHLPFYKVSFQISSSTDSQ